MKRCALLLALALLLLACGEAAPTVDARAPDAGLDGAPRLDGLASEGRADLRPDGKPSGKWQKTIADLVAPLLKGEWAVGLVVGLQTDEGVEVYGFGSTKLTGGAVPDGQTVFEIGSISKTFTSLLLASLVEQQKVTLEQPVQELLPAGQVTVPSLGGEAILLRHLSTHTSGLPRMPDNFAPANPDDPYADYTPELMYTFLTGCALASEPGAKFSYSNLGATLLGHALTLKAGASYEAMLKGTITDPLQLADTVIALSPAQRARFAEGHADDNTAIKPWSFGVMAPAGAIHSTAEDLLRYLAAQSGRDASSLAAAMSLTHTSQFNISGAMSIGLGWFLSKPSGYVWHNGMTGGFNSFAGYDPKSKAAVVVLASTATIQDPPTLLGLKLLDVLGGKAATAIDLPPTLAATASKLQPFTGTFALDGQPGYKVQLALNGDALYAILPKQAAVRFWPQSAEKFYSRLVYAWITFKKGASGGYDSLLMEQDGVTPHTYTRVP